MLLAASKRLTLTSKCTYFNSPTLHSVSVRSYYIKLKYSRFYPSLLTNKFRCSSRFVCTKLIR